MTWFQESEGGVRGEVNRRTSLDLKQFIDKVGHVFMLVDSRVILNTADSLYVLSCLGTYTYISCYIFVIRTRPYSRTFR